jgi:hypothetical protein
MSASKLERVERGKLTFTYIIKPNKYTADDKVETAISIVRDSSDVLKKYWFSRKPSVTSKCLMHLRAALDSYSYHLHEARFSKAKEHQSKLRDMDLTKFIKLPTVGHAMYQACKDAKENMLEHLEVIITSHIPSSDSL